jgi:hypothetical protein
MFPIMLNGTSAAEPTALSKEPQGPKWLEGCRAAVEEAIMSKALVANMALRFWLIGCLEAIFTFSAVAHHLYGTVKAFLQVRYFLFGKIV